METVLISGGSGLIGAHLSKKLIAKGYRVGVLSRSSGQDGDVQRYVWEIEKGEIEKGAIESADYIIHLAGAEIAEKRWTKKRKQEIVDSRVKTGQLIFDKVKESTHRPKAFISASATGYYGAVTSDKIFSETDPPARDFLGETCRLCERSAERFEEIGIRVVKIRTPPVLTGQGGVLEKILIPVRLGIGSAIGKGDQYFPWIHIDDLCGIYIKAIEDIQMRGAYNAAAPEHKTNRDFIKTLARVLHKPFWFPAVPAFVIKIILGKASEIILEGSRISSDKIRAAGYEFLYHDLEEALKNLFVKKG